MLYGIKKDYASGKAKKIWIKKSNFFSDTYYEASIYTQKPKEKLPCKEDIQKIAAIIPYAEMIKDQYQDYTHKITLPAYPSIQIRVKKIDKPQKEDSNNETA